MFPPQMLILGRPSSKAFSIVILIDDQSHSLVSALSNVIFPFFRSWRTYPL